jgi:hypothetical protein
MRHLRAFTLLASVVIASLALGGCDKDRPKPEETKKSEPVPVPSGLVFNDFLPTEGPVKGLGVRDASLEGGLAAVGASGEPAESDAAAQNHGKLRVTDPGAEPRALRKYTFVANRTERRILTIVQSVSRSVGNQAAPTQEITMKLHLDLTPKLVTPAGAMVEAKVAKVELPGTPPQAAQMLAALNGLSGTFQISPRGEPGEVSFVASQQLRNELAETVIQGLSQAVELLLAPFPDAPIGTGAKWEMGSSSPDQPEQGTKKFTLKEVNAEGGVVDAEIEIKVPRRAQQGPRGGMVFVEAEGAGKYTYQVRFDRMSTKVEGELSLNERLEVPDPKSGGKQTMTQSQKAKHLIEAPAAPAAAGK